MRDALDIWLAGVRAVQPHTLIQRKFRLEHLRLVIDDVCEIDLGSLRRLIIVGAGKASAAMAVALHHQILSRIPAKKCPSIIGWINSPEGTFHDQLPNIQLHSARPLGINAPTQAAIEGTEQILRLVSTAGPEDVVICLLSGGGSALLVSPRPGITLDDKRSVARWIAAAGGDIQQLNRVRRCLSRVKGGGLARACKAGRLISLIVSDVLGDPLDVIASGPTALGDTALGDTAIPWGLGSQSMNHRERAERAQALGTLNDLNLLQLPEMQSVVDWLRNAPLADSAEASVPMVENVILGNNADAVDAAGVRAVELGYRYVMQSARKPEGDVSQVAQQAILAMDQLCSQPETDCWISGGEPTVVLPKYGVGKGGRNQQLCLCVLERLVARGWPRHHYTDCELAFVSGGTDGEDGPTDAAGAAFDSITVSQMNKLHCRPKDYRERADAYPFFSQVGGLMVTGPTGTNVCDLRIALRKN